MKSGRILFTLILIIVGFSGRAQNYQELVNKTYAQRYHILDTHIYRQYHLDSVAFFRELAKIEAVANKAGDQELILETELLRCDYYLFGKQNNYRLFESRIQALKEVADNKEILPLQIKTRQKLGYYYFVIPHKYGPAFDNYLNAYRLLKDIPVKDFPDKQELVASVGTAYYQFGDNANARRFLTEAFKTPSLRPRVPISLTNTLGLIYREEHRYDSAEFYLWKTYRMAKALKDSTWMGIAAGNIGISYFYQQKYPEAIPLLKLDIKESLKAHETDNAVTSLIILAKIYLQQNQLTQTDSLISYVRDMLKNTSNPLKHQRELLPLQARLQAIRNDFKTAYLLSDSAHAVKDSLSTRKNNQLVTQVEREIELEKHRSEMQQLEAQEKLQETLRNSLIIGIILLMIIAYLIINRQQLVHKQKEQKLELEKRSVEIELESATKQLNDFTNSIREKNKQIEQFTAEIERQGNRALTPELEASKEARDKLLKATLLTDDQWEAFRALFEKVHVGYLQRMREKLPNLSPADTRYIVLSKLNLTPKEMASMLGIRPDTLRMTRLRLRTKLALEDEQALKELVNTI